MYFFLMKLFVVFHHFMTMLRYLEYGHQIIYPRNSEYNYFFRESKAYFKTFFSISEKHLQVTEENKPLLEVPYF